ncbi:MULTISPECIES: sensor histidine kinase [Paenibacillus]|uniref:sensor histidine kinase n=1 Tax=Paenibacillus TaxID=44249 RepID=UPI0022B93528|nr:histidine kinase [Paenibacillus caseinilyticus]MCZ8522620.1 histidine kinase [Paenibacillus caseinilyticus]
MNTAIAGGKRAAFRPGPYLLFVLGAVLLLAAASLLLAGEAGRRSPAGSLAELDAKAPWEVLLGDLPASGGVPEDGTGGWKPLREVQQSAEGMAHTGPFWIRIALPSKADGWRDPYLRVQRQFQYEVYADGIRLGGRDPLGADRFMHSSFGWKMYRLPSAPMPRTLLVKITRGTPGVFIGQYTLAEGRALLTEMIRYDVVGLLCTLFFVLLGAGSLLFWWRSHRDPAYLSLALLAFMGGLAYLLRSQTFQLLPHSSIPVYMADLPGVAATGAFFLFLYHFSREGAPKHFRLQAAVLFAFSTVTVPLLFLLEPAAFRNVYNLGLLPQLLLGAVTSLIFIVRRMKARPGAEDGWILTGIFSAVFGVILHVGGGLLPAVPGFDALRGSPAYEYFSQNAAGLGMLLLVASFSMALMTRMARIRREHQAFTESLEWMVKERTAELQEANRLLRLSVQERSEAIAALSVMEERTRIAGDIHDVVGHTLTTTLVQIEAARRLLQRQDERGMEKLELSGELVRQSLQDIRESVHMMQAASSDYDLERIIPGLLARTESAAGVEVQGRMGKLPPLTILQKKVLFHTLQEGLTNGIRHGEARRFRYELEHADGQVRFALWNDGHPYRGEQHGFGLTTMRERVQQVGGTLEVSSPEGTDYLLSIRFPVA